MISRLFGWVIQNRDRLPRFVGRLLDDVSEHPDGVLSRVAQRMLRLGGAPLPEPTAAPVNAIRVYIGPTNYAGQGRRWAGALESAGYGARNMAVDLPGGFFFPADTRVPLAVYNGSRQWQEAEADAVRSFSHVLIEAERPLFGRLFDRDVRREVAYLDDAGLRVAFLCHGTDIRSPRRHQEATRWSPYGDDPKRTAVLQEEADANAQLLAELRLPVFVSTPDLLADVPDAVWCPVVIDPDRWSAPDADRGGRPVVVHVPSMGSVKGTHLIEPTMRRLADEGVVEYSSLRGVPSADMPEVIAGADIVLDQFRLGSYGVAACEAMAAGRTVVGHVLPDARQVVRTATGLELPIVEADPETLEEVIRGLAADADLRGRLARTGREFARQVHGGSASVAALRDTWIAQAGSGTARAASR